MTENKLNESTNNDDAEKSIIDERKKDYLANKKIVMNKATDDNDNVSLLAAAPEKLVDKVQLNMENKINNNLAQHDLVVDHSPEVMLKFL